MVNKIHYLYTRICLIIFKYNCLSTSVGVLNQKKKKVELLKTLHFPKLTSFEGGLLLSLNFSLLCEELKSEDDCIKLDNLVNCRVLHLHQLKEKGTTPSSRPKFLLLSPFLSETGICQCGIQTLFLRPCFVTSMQSGY